MNFEEMKDKMSAAFEKFAASNYRPSPREIAAAKKKIRSGAAAVVEPRKLPDLLNGKAPAPRYKRAPPKSINTTLGSLGTHINTSKLKPSSLSGVKAKAGLGALAFGSTMLAGAAVRKGIRSKKKNEKTASVDLFDNLVRKAREFE